MEVVYIKNDLKLFEHEKYVYEVDLYTVYDDRVELDNTKYLASNTLLNFKHYENKILDKHSQQIKYTNLVGAPLDYLNNNYFKKHEYYTRKELRKLAREKKKNNIE